MILSLFTQWAKRARLATARRAYAQARAEWKAAFDRQDCRRMHDAGIAMRRTNAALMAAEAAALPKQPLLPTPKGT